MTARKGLPTVCLAASPGGHLAELQATGSAFADYPRRWVTGPSRQADSLRDAGETVHLLPAWARDTSGLDGILSNFRTALHLAREFKPDAVITNGAGLIVPYAVAARMGGSQLILIETMARVTSPSLTGRILAPLARTVLIQWPELRRFYRRADLCRPVLLESPQAGALRDGRGTFVSVGTRPEPFDRLLAIVDRAVERGWLPRPVVAQSGVSSYQPTNYAPRPSMKPTEIAEAVRTSRFVICHGGSGMMASAIAAGHRPLVLARRKSAGEHRTEHQHQIVEKLAGHGLVVAVHDEIGEREVALAQQPLPDLHGSWPGPSMEERLRQELSSLLGE